MKYVYVKANNVVRELQRVGVSPENLPEGGPDAYVAHFLRYVDGEDCLLFSTHFLPVEKDEHFNEKNVRATSFYWHNRWLKPFGQFYRNPVATFFTRSIKSIKLLAQIVRFRPDRVLCWSASFTLWATFLASRISGASFVYSRHNRLVRKTEPAFRRFTAKFDEMIMRNSDAVIVHGPYLKDQVRGIGVRENQIVEFAWNFSDLSESAQRLGHQDGAELFARKKILFVGRLEPSKGVFDLYEAFKNLAGRYPDLELEYAGLGKAYESLAAKIEADGLADRVRLLGYVPHSDLVNHIYDSTLVSTPTKSSFPEGRCMATIEGLVLKRPVIAPDFGPFPYVVEHEVNGLLFKPDSVLDLTAVIDRIMSDIDLYKKLLQGAEHSSRELLMPSKNYIAALQEAFKK